MSVLSLQDLSIILVRPRFPENIGAAVRSACNMGVGEICVVQPENFDLPRIHKMATHACVDFIGEQHVYLDLQTALAPFHYVFGTTARLGGEREKVLTPPTAAQKIIPMLSNNKVALVFGSEDRGLENTEIRLCHELIHIPTADFSSVNLAQAVMILCYECFTTLREQTTSASFFPRMATHTELAGLYNELTPLLTKIHYVNPENPDYWMNKVRHFLHRMKLQAVEVSILRGICRQMNWYVEKRYEDGKQETLSFKKEP